MAPVVPAPKHTTPPTTPPIESPSDPAPNKPTRAELAKLYGAHPLAIALPDEVPVKRRPRYARARYDVKNFDVRAFLPQAQALAAKELAAPRLIEIEIRDLAPDGRVDLTRVYGGVKYTFVTATPIEQGCKVIAEVGPRDVQLYVDSGFGNTCSRTAIAPPRCSLATVWANAEARGATTPDRSTITYNHDGWYVSTAAVRVQLPECP
jgi:hypothetical protein